MPSLDIQLLLMSPGAELPCASQLSPTCSPLPTSARRPGIKIHHGAIHRNYTTMMQSQKPCTQLAPGPSAALGWEEEFDLVLGALKASFGPSRAARAQPAPRSAPCDYSGSPSRVKPAEGHPEVLHQEERSQPMPPKAKLPRQSGELTTLGQSLNLGTEVF